MTQYCRNTAKLQHTYTLGPIWLAVYSLCFAAQNHRTSAMVRAQQSMDAEQMLLA